MASIGSNSGLLIASASVQHSSQLCRTASHQPRASSLQAHAYGTAASCGKRRQLHDISITSRSFQPGRHQRRQGTRCTKLSQADPQATVCSQLASSASARSLCNLILMELPVRSWPVKHQLRHTACRTRTGPVLIHCAVPCCRMLLLTQVAFWAFILLSAGLYRISLCPTTTRLAGNLGGNSACG